SAKGNTGHKGIVLTDGHNPIATHTVTPTEAIVGNTTEVNDVVINTRNGSRANPTTTTGHSSPTLDNSGTFIKVFSELPSSIDQNGTYILKLSSPTNHKEAGKGKNVTMSNIVLNSNGSAIPNEASTSKGGNMAKTTNSFELLNTLEVDPMTHERPSDPKDSTQSFGLGKSNVHVNEDSESDVEEIYDETAHFMASKGTKEGKRGGRKIDKKKDNKGSNSNVLLVKSNVLATEYKRIDAVEKLRNIGKQMLEEKLVLLRDNVKPMNTRGDMSCNAGANYNGEPKYTKKANVGDEQSAKGNTGHKGIVLTDGHNPIATHTVTPTGAIVGNTTEVNDVVINTRNGSRANPTTTTDLSSPTLDNSGIFIKVFSEVPSSLDQNERDTQKKPFILNMSENPLVVILGADDEGFIEVKRMKSGGNFGGTNTSNRFSNTFKDLNVDDLNIEEVAMGSKVTTIGTQEEGECSVPLIERIKVFEKLIMEDKLVLVDVDGKPLEKEQWRDTTINDEYDPYDIDMYEAYILKLSSPTNHKEAGKGKNVTMSNIVLNSNGSAIPNEASTSKGGNMAKTTNSFELLNTLEVDPMTHERPSDPKDSTQSFGLGKSNVHVNEDSKSDVEEIYDETAHFMASKGTKEGIGIWK
nr:isocitrate lyase [Tanacetum cinerariifolium]